MIFTSSQNERMQFDNARAQLSANKNISQSALENCVLTQSYLRIIQTLNITGTVFNFPVLSNQTGSGVAVRPDEFRLNQQDAFYVSKINVYLAKAATATSVAYLPATYPNAVTFPTGAAPLSVFYNGRMTIVINNSVIVPGYPMENFLQIPQTQLTAAANSPQDQFDGTLQIPWEPNIVFVGTFNSQINIVLPGNITAIDATTLAIVEVQGVLAQNVALGAQ